MNNLSIIHAEKNFEQFQFLKLGEEVTKKELKQLIDTTKKTLREGDLIIVLRNTTKDEKSWYQFTKVEKIENKKIIFKDSLGRKIVNSSKNPFWCVSAKVQDYLYKNEIFLGKNIKPKDIKEENKIFHDYNIGCVASKLELGKKVSSSLRELIVAKDETHFQKNDYALVLRSPDAGRKDGWWQLVLLQEIKDINGETVLYFTDGATSKMKKPSSMFIALKPEVQSFLKERGSLIKTGATLTELEKERICRKPEDLKQCLKDKALLQEENNWKVVEIVAENASQGTEYLVCTDSIHKFEVLKDSLQPILDESRPIYTAPPFGKSINFWFGVEIHNPERFIKDMDDKNFQKGECVLVKQESRTLKGEYNFEICQFLNKDEETQQATYLSAFNYQGKEPITHFFKTKDIIV